ncbi:MAG: radical SAM protein [Lachnospiraceae bacterium]|nr:radical SAM protein [Lachnospiraceae bacterium]
MSEQMAEGIKCALCPRQCHVDRDRHKGYCGESRQVRVARASLHMWEEPCISGSRGSGTVFFSGCPLRCVFCQNRKIALGDKGRMLRKEQLSELFLMMQSKGAHNINLVTPTHFVPQIIEALKRAKNRGLSIPIVYNTAGYESVETLRMLDGFVDIYLPDFKFYNAELSAKYSRAPDYFACASDAVEEMVRQTGSLVFDSGLMKRGVIVRHMVMPGHVKDAKAVIKYLYEKYRDDIYISIMNQYTPPDDLADYPEISRRVTRREYEKVVEYAIELGVENAFVQEGGTAKESFIPDFDEELYLKEVVR